MMVSVNVQQKCFLKKIIFHFSLNLSSLGHSRVSLLFANEEQEKAGS